MRNRKIKLFSMIIIILSIIIFSTNVFAIGEIFSAGNFLKVDEIPISKVSVIGVSDVLSSILLGIGIIIVIIWGALLGVKFILSSPDDKASVKDSLLPFIIGSVVIFGGYAIWQILVTLFNSSV